MKKKAYIYPITAFEDKIIPNPYLENLMDSLSNEVDFINRTRPSNKGILDITGYYKKIDLLFLNWIEDIPDKKGGMIQVLFFMILTRILIGRKILVIWTMHNKLSHYNTHTRLKKFLFRFLIRNSSLILTHSTEGIRYAGEYHVPDYKRKMKFFPHPLEKKFIEFDDTPTYDVLIWGSVIPYKNIDGFLRYLHEKGIENRYRICIAGKVKPKEYEEIIREYCTNTITLDNRYIPDEELVSLIAKSKAVIFTHAEDSVLSSGALMDSLSFGATVIAPDIAAFKDAREVGLIETFQTFDELVDLLNLNSTAPRKENTKLNRFINESTWSQYAKNVLTWIETNKRL